MSVRHFSDTEIREIRVILPANIAHEDVRRLNISMHEAGLMDRVERQCQLRPNAHRPLCVQPMLAVNEGPQLQAINPLHGQVEPAGVLADIKHRNDVWMVNRSGKAGLPQETRAVVTGLGNFRTYHFKSHGASKRSLLGSVDNTHATRAGHLDDVVRAESLAHGQIRTHSAAFHTSLACWYAERLAPPPTGSCVVARTVCHQQRARNLALSLDRSSP